MSQVDLSQPLWMLLIFVALGWLCARRLAVDPRPIATLLIYLIAPLTFFRGLYLGEPSPALLGLTAGMFALASLLCLATHAVVRRYFAPQEAALLAFSAGTGNTGYFGLPLAMALLPPEGVAAYLFCLLGVTLFEFSVGFYISARGQFSVRESLAKIVRLPLLYAFIAALLAYHLPWSVPGAVIEGLDYFRASYTVLGMMIIGMTLGGVSMRAFDARFLGVCIAARYVMWPLVMLGLVLGLQATMGISATLAGALLLLGVVPMAANVVVIAMELNIRPAKGAIAVLVTTVAAPLIIPPYLDVLWRLVGLD
ncbi:AEC family transporter [Chromohalobacter sp. TMW 2.2308]|uniref:AEC family transporter n=1 Tax=Chromohalobacter TaxID=42054 RepID=UPI001FFD087C|nr:MULTISPECIES: AEC family transporter [Chromohalobacter]MCK2043039.1 AEC family transporter [Chromohalobacter moromii]MCT8515724.1 AEC family transporter [Chromohalobacter sp. TMW 2.2271]